MKILIQPILIVLIFTLFGSCKKDKQFSYKIINTHRLKQYTSSTDGKIERKEVYTYEEEKLVSRSYFSRNSSGILEESNKAEISYEGENATLYWLASINGRFVENYKKEYSLSNYMLIQETDYFILNESWVKDWQISYQYSGKNVSTWQSFNDMDGIFMQTSKGEYTYIDSKVSESYSFILNDNKDWIQDDKETYTYEENKITEWIDYSLDNTNNWRNSTKVNYAYTKDLVNQEDISYWNNSTQEWLLKNSTYYIYDANGYLIETYDNIGNHTLFEYEKGNGNLSLFWYYPDDYITGSPRIKKSYEKLFNPIFKNL